MNWSEFCDARLLLAEERLGKHIRKSQRAELEAEESSQDILRSRGMVS